MFSSVAEASGQSAAAILRLARSASIALNFWCSSVSLKCLSSACVMRYDMFRSLVFPPATIADFMTRTGQRVSADCTLGRNEVEKSQRSHAPTDLQSSKTNRCQDANLKDV